MTTCDRCGYETNAFTGSYFNTEIICLRCRTEEEKHPLWEKAREMELQAVQRGDNNFPGIGLPDELKK
jgi:recombinational DNA repair protein (RecF pathway)